MKKRLRLLLSTALALALGGLNGLSTVAADTPTASSAAGQTALPSQQVRVIVRFLPTASSVRARVLSIKSDAQTAQQVSQARALALGKRLGLSSLTSSRAMDERTHVMTATGIEARELVRRIRADAEVELVAIDHVRHRSMVPNDPYYTTVPINTAAGTGGPVVGQWYLKAPTQAQDANGLVVLSTINAEKAWDLVSGVSKPVVVAVLDTGVRPEHPDLSGRFVSLGYSMISNASYSQDGQGRHADATDPGDWVTDAQVNDKTSVFYHCTTKNSDGTYSGESSSWHGTQVSGLIGATFNNGVGIAGAGAAAVQLLPVRVLASCGGYDSDIVDGMKWAAGLAVSGVPSNPNPAKVLNMSLGGSGSCSTLASNPDASTAQLYQETIAAVNAAGAVVVIAAGNDGGLEAGIPATCPGAIAVAALRHTGTKVGFSDLGPEVAIAAPGGNCVNTASNAPCLYPMLSTVNTGTQGPVASAYTDSFNAGLGTSFSTPLVSATAGMMFAVNANLTPAKLLQTLQSTATSFPQAPVTGTSSTPPVCQAPSSTGQNECFCTTSTCGAGMLNSYAAVSAAMNSSVAQAPFAQVAPTSTSAMAGGSITLDASGTLAYGGTISSYAWKVLSGSATLSASTGRAVTVTGTQPGTVVVQLTATDTNGRASIQSTTLAFSASTATAVITAAQSSVAVGASVQLSAANSLASSGATLSSYAWSITSGAANAQIVGASTGPTVTVQGSAAGSVTVQLKITDSAGSTATATQALTVQQPPTAAFTASASTVTAGNGVTLSSTSTAANGASLSTYSWSITSGSAIASLSSNGNSSSATLSTTAAGSVTVMLTVTDSNGLSNSSSQTLTVTAASSGGSGSSGSSSGGGGGLMSPLWLLGLLAAVPLLRRARRR